ncbi:molybdenum cofactor synthesis domain-containing protein [Desulfohalotomaculum tongense]|uniref:molybdenum cofactor synthesis domain-containing protein n=1 Tax=Desulforadius tongensis TaxID=1216062 RepID=UPI00195988F3|nr:molybdenum cofactor synthesis domain-containing protein [Desulforadius tongensis]
MIKVGILTMSDKGARGEREDKSCEVIKEMVKEIGGEVKYYKIIPDDFDVIKEELFHCCDRLELDLVLTTGGTGFGPRDNTPEATIEVIKKQAPGITEAMRMESLKKTPKAMLSRAAAGIRGKTLIINLPGSPRGVRECLSVVLPVLPHGLEILSGRGGECGKE